jgi:hypothetical protein
MEKELGEAKNTGEKILRWNIMDITEKCPESKHLPDQPKVQRYIRPKKLPLVNLSPEEYTMVPDAQQKDFEPITAYAGCATCPLLSICQTKLAHRPKEETGGLYKPINFTIRQFKITSPDMAEAQLLCWKPSLSGLVYPRFEESSDVISVADAWKFYTGNDGNKNTDFKTLVDAMHYAGTPFNVGLDWGHAHAFAITVSAMVRGEWWFFDCYAQSGLEFEDMMKLLREVKRIYNPAKVAPDDSQPMFIKAARKDARLNCVKFTKDVAGGIELVRAKIVDGTGKRRLKIIRHERTEFLINGFKKHHFKLDAAGIPTKDPDDEEYADVMDTVRYQAQILFEKESTIRTAPNDPPKQTVVSIQEKAHIEANKNWITDKVAELQVNNGGLVKNKSGSIIADFGDE